ncbi:hypothetical protein [Sandarakinorhabdus sp.]|uniref:hypothetical protein n=1 Tax=Sandarakinorhabdus sp. TaxID=1916663 RepID=UPI00286DFC4F|nr:hypothetical protein [Sandarakinorhabdus sp.]
MPDNVTAPAAGVAFATDEVGGVHFPYAKLAFGADNAAIVVADANGARLPVLITVPAGQVIGLDAATLAALESVNATVAGTVALDGPTLAALESINAAISGTVELGAATLAALETINAVVDRLGQTTRNYDDAAGQRLTTAGAGPVRSTAVAATEVLLHASVRGFVRVGTSTVDASVGPGSIPLEAGEKWHRQITSGQFISFIRDGATDGSLSIVPVA